MDDFDLNKRCLFKHGWSSLYRKVINVYYKSKDEEIIEF